MLGRFGDLVDRVRMICQAVDDRGHRRGRARYSGATGGMGGKVRRTWCRAGGYANSLIGGLRIGDHAVVESLSLECRAPR
jgi:hypothetical protein